MRWADIPNPAYLLRPAQKDKAAELYRSLWGDGAEELVSIASSQPTLRVIDLQITNNSDIRSKELEIGGDDSSAVFTSDRLVDGIRPFSRSIKIRQLDPGQTVNVSGVSASYSFMKPTVRLIYDNRLVSVEDYVIDQELVMLGLIQYGARHPVRGLVMEMAIIFLGLLLVAATVYWSLWKLDPKRFIKLQTDKDIMQWIRFLRAVSKVDPVRLASLNERVKLEDKEKSSETPTVGN
jgi:hypothetical protein